MISLKESSFYCSNNSYFISSLSLPFNALNTAVYSFYRTRTVTLQSIIYLISLSDVPFTKGYFSRGYGAFEDLTSSMVVADESSVSILYIINSL